MYVEYITIPTLLLPVLGFISINHLKRASFAHFWIGLAVKLFYEIVLLRRSSCFEIVTFFARFDELFVFGFLTMDFVVNIRFFETFMDRFKYFQSNYEPRVHVSMIHADVKLHRRLIVRLFGNKLLVLIICVTNLNFALIT